MSGYGFRLYTVKLVSGYHKSKSISFDTCGARGNEHVAIWIRRVLSRLEGFHALTGPPEVWISPDEDDLREIDSYQTPPVRGDYQTEFTGHLDSPAHRIRFQLNYGRTGKVTKALQASGTVEVGHVPTGDAYRAILYLPATGETGLLALESVPSAPNPQRMLNRWLARAAIDVYREDLLELATLDDDARVGFEPRAYKLNFNQYPNLERIEAAVLNSDTANVVLKREEIDGAGIPTDEDLVVTSSLKSQSKKDAAGKVAMNMVRKLHGKLDEGEQAVTIEDLEDLVDGDLSGVDWTEGYIQIDDNGLKKIGLEHIDKFFVYPLASTVPLDAEEFERRVALEVVDLQSTLGLDLPLS